jgi:hypothetical protein
MEFSFSFRPSTARKDLKRSGFGTGLAETNVVLWADPCFVQANFFRSAGPPSGAGMAQPNEPKVFLSKYLHSSSTGGSPEKN